MKIGMMIYEFIKNLIGPLPIEFEFLYFFCFILFVIFIIFLIALPFYVMYKVWS